MVNILGEKYEIIEVPKLEDCFGYVDWTTRKIVVQKELEVEHEDKEVFRKKVLRHEIIHAFFIESGLCASSAVLDAPWATNEEMVDWIARQGLKIYKAWEEAGAV